MKLGDRRRREKRGKNRQEVIYLSMSQSLIACILEMHRGIPPDQLKAIV